MSNSRLLIIDDDNATLNFYASLLGDLYDVKVANNSNIAIEILEKFSIDLILLDISLPNQNGFELVNIIKNIDNNKNTPFIFVSALSDEESIVKGFEMGAVDYVTKPVKKEELKQRIKLHLKNSNKEKQASISHILNAIAHEWKQPLSVVLLLAQEIGLEYEYETLDKKSIENRIGDIKFQINHLLTTLDEFKELFKLKSNIVPFDFDRMFKGVLKLARTDISINNIKIQSNIKTNGFINANEHEIKHIFLNLIANSRFAFIDNDIKNRTISIDTSEDLEFYNIILKTTQGEFHKT